MKLFSLVILPVDFFQSTAGIDFTFQTIIFAPKEYHFYIPLLVTLLTPQGKKYHTS